MKPASYVGRSPWAALAIWLACMPALPASAAASFVNFETAPVHPLALSPDGAVLALCNLPDSRLELFDVSSGTAVPIGNVPVGLDPVSVRFRSNEEVWVVNHISDSINVVDLTAMRVAATVATGDGPSDILFAGEPLRAFVSCAGANEVRVIDPVTLETVRTIPIEGQRPRAMALDPSGQSVYVAIFESGNRTTILSPALGELDAIPQHGAVSFPDGPHAGLNPPPNADTEFDPAINPDIPADIPIPRAGLIVRKDEEGRWRDDNDGDWTGFVSGTNAVFTGRLPGWDVLDHDVAVIDTTSFEVRYLTGLMNICMAVAVNPASGQVTVVGTEALNHVRFEPVLRGGFIRVHLALADPDSEEVNIQDLNPHLDYSVAFIDDAERAQSIGDPRGIVWNSAGTRAYVTGMGSDNLVILDAQGRRIGNQPAVKLGEGPTGVALDESRNRLYIWNRFDSTLSVVDTGPVTVVDTVAVFDPTPVSIRTGRKHLYNTHSTSGLGQASCASCHVDARFDRLAWDLGDPLGEARMLTLTNANFARFVPDQTNHFHPMKGPMVTQTLQDIIGHEPFHWRGDRSGIEEFNGTFTNLQARAELLATNEMREFKEFLATIRFPPNPHRRLDNTLSTSLPVTGHFSLGRGALAAGEPLPNGNAIDGMTRFRTRGNEGCIHCHTLPTGLGPNLRWSGFNWQSIPPGPDDEQHVSLIQVNRSAQLPFKIPQLRNLHDKLGMNTAGTRSQTGFGFLHDGSVDSLVRFVQDGFDLRDDQETADLIAFLLSITGSDLPAGIFNDPELPPGLPGNDVPTAVGHQLTFVSPTLTPALRDMLALAAGFGSRVDLVAHGSEAGIRRGWIFNLLTGGFQSDRNGETLTSPELRALASSDNPLTWMLVSRGTGRRISIDRDEDGWLNLTEVEFGSDPANPLSLATNRPPQITPMPNTTVAAGDLLTLTVSAEDPDIPIQNLAFDLDPPAPDGVSIDPASGVLTWQPTQAQALATHPITVRVTDDGSPNQSTTSSFSIEVLPHPLTPIAGPVEIVNGDLTLSWSAVPEHVYRVQFKNSIDDPTWLNLPGDVTATGDRGTKMDPSASSATERYYRIVLIE